MDIERKIKIIRTFGVPGFVSGESIRLEGEYEEARPDLTSIEIAFSGLPRVILPLASAVQVAQQIFELANLLKQHMGEEDESA
jgi:hypothetical protein